MGQIDPNRIRNLANDTLQKALATSPAEPLSLASLSNPSLTEAPVEEPGGALRMTLSFTIQNSPTPQVVAARTDPMRLAFAEFAGALGVQHDLRSDMQDPFTLRMVLDAQGPEEKVRAFIRAAVEYLR